MTYVQAVTISCLTAYFLLDRASFTLHLNCAYCFKHYYLARDLMTSCRVMLLRQYFCHKNLEGILSLNFLVKKHGRDLLLELKCTKDFGRVNTGIFTLKRMFSVNGTIKFC